MSKPSIVSKVMTLVKGVFGQKTEAPAPGPASIPVQQGSKTEKADTVAKTDTTEKTAAAASEAKPATRSEATEVPATGEKAAAAKDDAPEAATDSDTPAAKDETPAAEEPPLVAGEEKDAIADEIARAEATTQVASDDVLEKVRKQSAPAAEDLPVPGYDSLTLPSIRARLRKLTIDEVRDLRSYEIANAERPEFVKMYDNRIAKLRKTGEGE
ncbi:hypothetical protein [Nocardiopsis rhodophaea]|uniref:hypothetical protein n=1 Tax=Nocardiopsis rhodophaea TaxID=280238 RepID=UPI0031DFA507